MGLPGLTSRCLRGRILSGVESISLPFPASRGSAGICLLRAPFCLYVRTPPCHISDHSSIETPLLPPSVTFKDLCDYVGLQDNPG